MHEMPVTQSLLKTALQYAEKEKAKRVTGLHIVMGELSKMADDSIRFYWEMIARDTIAEHARLLFRRVPAEFQCMACFQKYHPNGEEIKCPVCGSVGAKIIAGEEFSLEAIDIE